MNPLTQTRLKSLLLALVAAWITCGPAHADITSGLKVQLLLNESTGLTAFDATTNHHDATLNNFPGDDSQWVSGRIGGALIVNPPGVTFPYQYAAIDDSTNDLNFGLAASPAVTLSAWVRGDLGVNQSSGSGIICKGTGGGGESYALDSFQNSYRFFVRDGAGVAYTIQLSTNLVTGRWQHIVGVFDSTAAVTNRVALYINGQLITKIAGPVTLLSSSHEVSVGARELNGGSGYNLPFYGRVDDARIYSRALSAADVLELYQAAGPLAPQILTQPVGANVFVGEQVNLTLLVDVSTPVTYQWKQDGTNAVNGTNVTLTFASVQLTNAGTYTVAITNAAGYAVSAGALLNVTDPPSDLTSGLVAHLKMDETTGLTAFDSTVNAHDATLINFPGDDSQWVAGRATGADHALNFTNSAYATIDDSAGGLNFATQPVPAFTVALWARGIPGAQTNGAGVIAKGYGNGGEQYAIDVQNGAYRFYLRDGAGAAVGLSPGTAVNGAWQHLVVVYNNTNSLKFYVNGQVAGALASGPATLLNTTHEISLGIRESSSFSGYDNPFTGREDDVRIYNRALTPTEVQLLYTNAGVFAPVVVIPPANTTNFVLTTSAPLSVVADGTVPFSYQWRQEGTNVPNATNASLSYAVSQLANSGNYTVVITNLYGSVTSAPAYLAIVQLATNDYTSGLVAEWNFDETSGTTAADSSGRGNTLNLVNFPADNSQWVTTSRIGGRALRFNAVADDVNGGTNDYAITASGLAMPYDYINFTFAFWIKLDSTTLGVNPRIITPVVTHWVLFQPGNGLGFFTPQPTTLPQLNKWTHFVVTYDRNINRYSVFANGVQQVTNAAPGAAKAATTAATLWKVGHNEGVTDADYFRGQLDDVRVYNRQLTASQAAALYAAAPPLFQVAAQPQPATVTERDPVKFTFGVDSSSSDPVTYQWKRNGVDMPGETATTLSMTYARLADNGATYTAFASNSLGSVLSSGAVLTVNALPAADTNSNLLTWYKFDETTGDTAVDSSGNGLDATLNNWHPSAAKWEAGVLGNALHFNGGPFNSPDTNNNYVLMPPPTLANNLDFTFAFWARKDPAVTTDGNPRIISPFNNLTWVLWKQGSGVGFWNGAWGAPEPTTNAWHHYVVTFTRSTSRYNVYVDGVRQVFQGVPTSPATEVDPSGFGWVIGIDAKKTGTGSHTESFRGWLDDLRVYNRLLTINDVEALYQAANLGPKLSLQSGGGKLTFSWPSWATAYTLKHTADLINGPWVTAPGGPPTLSGGSLYQTNDLGSGSLFFRLVK